MNRIDRKFKSLSSVGKKAFIAYITAGDPDLAATSKLARVLEDSGVDILELGIPFSDPIADGPTIQAASQRALKGGATLRKIFGLVGDLRKVTDIPIIFMTYYNPVYRYGVRVFFAECARRGVDGVIIPDLPYEEGLDVSALGSIHKVDNILLAAPTSTGDRVRNIARISKGFVYYVSLAGVTGARRKLPEAIKAKVKAIKSISGIPVCVGFGISDAAQAKAMAAISDGVIVGSAIIKVIEDNLKDRAGMIRKVRAFSKKIAGAIHNAK